MHVPQLSLSLSLYMHYQFNSSYKMTNKHQKEVKKTHKLRSQIVGARFQVVFFEEKNQ